MRFLLILVWLAAALAWAALLTACASRTAGPGVRRTLQIELCRAHAAL